MVFRATISLLMSLVLCAPLSAKQMAVTFDKLPSMNPMGYWTARELSNLVLRALEAEGIKGAAGFVVEEKVADDTSSYVVLEDWVRAGHIIGNNTFSYADYNELSEDDFISHITDGAKYIRTVARNGQFTHRYFRFPMLHEGNSEKKKTSLAKKLFRAGYVVVPATVIVNDYEFNFPYQRFEYEEAQIKKLRELYLAHLVKSLEYAEQQSEKVFGRQIPQILQLHMGVATAGFMGDVLSLLKDRGYEFVPVLKALEDPAYKEADTYYGPLGLSFIDRIAATKGLPYAEDQGAISRKEIEAYLETSPSGGE